MNKNSEARVYIKGLACACLLFLCLLIVSVFTGNSTADSLRNDDLVMPEGTESLLDAARIKAEDCTWRNGKVTQTGGDPQLLFTFRNDESHAVRSVEAVFAEDYPYNLECSLYYENDKGEINYRSFLTAVLQEGQKRVVFVLPDHVNYEMKSIRLDIKDDYELEDIRFSSEKAQAAVYRIRDLSGTASWVLLFLLLAGVSQLICFFRKGLAGLTANLFRRRRSVFKAAAAVALPSFAVWAVIEIFQLLAHRNTDGFWTWLSVGGTGLAASQIWLLTRPLQKKKVVADDRESVRRRIFFWGILSAFCLMIAYKCGECFNAKPSLAADPRFVVIFAFAAAESLLLGLLFRRYVLLTSEGDVSFRKVYLYLIFLLAAAYLFVFLPFVSPDEQVHYLSSYRVSNLLLGRGGAPGDLRMIMRREDYSFFSQRQYAISSLYFRRTAEDLHLFRRMAGSVVIDAKMETNAIFCYLASGMGMAAARLLNLSGYAVFCAGRLGNVLFFCLTWWQLMKKTPFFRTVLFSIAVLPMTLSIAASYSYDVMTFCFVALYVTQVMCMVFRTGTVSRRDKILCALYGVLMAPSKLVYVPLLLLVFLIPDRKLCPSSGKAKLQKVFLASSGILACLIIMVIVNRVGTDPSLREMVNESVSGHILPYGDHLEGYTIGWILGHLGETLLIILRTVVRNLEYYYITLIGCKLGWLDINIPTTIALVHVLLIFLAIHIRDEASAQMKVSIAKKVWITLLCCASVGVTILAMMLNWTPLDSPVVYGVQGRYFLPLLIPLIWVLRDSMTSVNTAVRKRIVLISGLLNIWTLLFVYSITVFQT